MAAEALLVQQTPVVWVGGQNFSGFLLAETAFGPNPWNPAEASRLSVLGTVLPRFAVYRVRNGRLLPEKPRIFASSQYDYPGVRYKFHLLDEGFARRAEALGEDAQGYQVEGDFILPEMTPDPSQILSPVRPCEYSLL